MEQGFIAYAFSSTFKSSSQSGGDFFYDLISDSRTEVRTISVINIVPYTNHCIKREGSCIRKNQISTETNGK